MVSRALVIHHFGSKEACMYAVVEHIRNTMRARAARRDPAETALDQVLGLLDSLRTQDPHARAMFVILVESLTSSPGLLPAVMETNAVIREAISGVIKDAAADVVGGPPVDVDGLAVQIEAILRGVALQWLAACCRLGVSLGRSDTGLGRGLVGQCFTLPHLVGLFGGAVADVPSFDAAVLGAPMRQPERG
jgi:AcrR family transcriptional regulator